MVVCKFFLQGFCRFGDNCKFEHQISDSYNTNKTTHTSILWQSQLGNSQYQNQSNAPFQKQNNSIFGLQDNRPAPSSGNVDVDTLIKSVVNDMTGVEHSGQWLLSCYGPFKEKSIFPGFDDYSFEEIRTGFYEALKNGTLEQYKQHVNSLLQQAVLRIKSLQKPTAEIVEILKSIYYTQGTQTNTSTSIFGSTPSTFSQNTFPTQNNSIFAQANQNLFGKPPIQAPQFSNTTGSIFGGGQNITNKPQVPSQNIFGQVNANLGSQNNGSIFTNQQSNNIATPTSNTFQAATLFGQPTSQPNVFGNQNNMFQQASVVTTPSMFGNSPAQQMLQQSQQPVLPTGNMFGTNQISAPTFSQQTPIFNSQSFVASTPQQPQQGSIFGNQPANNLSNSPLFQVKGNETVNQSSNIFLRNLNPPPYDESLYSKLEELTDEEIKWFQSDDPDPMTIPEKPPTFEMCFKA